MISRPYALPSEFSPVVPTAHTTSSLSIAATRSKTAKLSTAAIRSKVLESGPAAAVTPITSAHYPLCPSNKANPLVHAPQVLAVIASAAIANAASADAVSAIAAFAN